MGRTQKLAAIIKEGVRNPQKIKKGLNVLKNQGPEIFKQRLSASVNYEPGYGRVKKEKLKNYGGEILFSIVMPVYNVEIKWLDKAIESIEKQNYKNWEICIADDCSTKQEVREHLSAMKNSRIKIKLLEKIRMKWFLKVGTDKKSQEEIITEKNSKRKQIEMLNRVRTYLNTLDESEVLSKKEINQGMMDVLNNKIKRLKIKK